MEQKKEKIFIDTVESTAEEVYEKIIDKVYPQSVFFDGNNFKVAPINGLRFKRYSDDQNMSLVGIYNEPTYAMILEDINSEIGTLVNEERK